MWKYWFVSRRSIVVGNDLRLLMICKCSSGGNCIREGMFVSVCLGWGALEVEEMAICGSMVLR